MRFIDLTTLDGLHGYIGISDRGFSAGLNCFLLDNPILRIIFTNSSATSVDITITDVNSNVLAQWTGTNTATEVLYYEIGDILKNQFVPPTPSATPMTFMYNRYTLQVDAYDTNNVLLNSYSTGINGWHKSKYTGQQVNGCLWPSLPSKMRMWIGATMYDYANYNVIGYAHTSGTGVLRFYNGSNTPTATITPIVMGSYASRMASTNVTHMIVTEADGDHLCKIEKPMCEDSVIALKWWSRVSGCWKSILLDNVGGTIERETEIPVNIQLAGDVLNAGNVGLVGRFPAATYRDYMYYKDILLGTHLTMSGRIPNPTGYFEDIPVKVSGNWSFRMNDIKDMDFNITIKDYTTND